HAQSSRLSLAERVARLEQEQAQGNSSEQTLELLNRINQLQTEVQSLRGLVEQQGFEIESLKKRARDQYLDLDSRIGRLEGNPLAPDPAAASPQGVTLPDNAQPLAEAPDPNVTTPTPVLME